MRRTWMLVLAGVVAFGALYSFFSGDTRAGVIGVFIASMLVVTTRTSARGDH